MAATPSISLVAYEARDHRVFVKVPDERGRYVLTSRAVVEVPCPHCEAARGEPCKGSQGYGASTHYTRDRAYRAARRTHTIPGPPPDNIEPKPRYKLVVANNSRKGNGR